MDWNQCLAEMYDFLDEEALSNSKNAIQIPGRISAIDTLGIYEAEFEIWTEEKSLLQPSHPGALIPGDMVRWRGQTSATVTSVWPERGVFRVLVESEKITEDVGQKITLLKNDLLFLVDRKRALLEEFDQWDSPLAGKLKGLLTGDLTLEPFSPRALPGEKPLEHALDSDQLAAVRAVVSTPDFWVVWGPPGTGKTHAVSAAIHLLLEQGKRVFITSHQHAAIDEVLLKVIQNFPHHRDKMVRIGHGGKVHSEIQPLLIQNLLGEGDEEDWEEELSQFPLVAATLSACTNSLMWDQTFDVVLEDEAGRPSVPTSLVGLMKATESFALIGDPLQLRPITPKTSKGWLEKSLLEIALANEEVAQKRKSELTQHRRSHPTLMGHAKEFYRRHGHRGLELSTAPKVEIPDLPRTKEPLLDSQTPLVYFNKPFSDCRWYKFGRSYSLMEPYEAALAYEAANQLAQRVSYEKIWILTPFRLQTHLIASLFRKEHQEKKLIQTIDQTQGGERDIVVVSLVADKKTTIANKIDLNRLNVALTRARAKLVVITNLLVLMECPHLEDFCTWLMEVGKESKLGPDERILDKVENKLHFLLKARKKFKDRVDENYPYPSDSLLSELSKIPRNARSQIQGIRRISFRRR